MGKMTLRERLAELKTGPRWSPWAMPHPGLLAPDSSRVFSLQRSLPTADIPEHPDRGKRINRLLVPPLRAPFKHEFDRFRTVEDEVPVRSGRDFCNILLRLRRHSRGLPPAGSRRHWEAGFGSARARQHARLRSKDFSCAVGVET